MVNDVTVINIREYLNSDDDGLGEEQLQKVLSEFLCCKNQDVDNFLKKHAVEFTKKNQSVTYLVFSNNDAEFLGYFTLAIKPISVNPEAITSNAVKRKIERVGKIDESTNSYNLSAYLIAQLGKNFINSANERITGECCYTRRLRQLKNYNIWPEEQLCF